MVGGASALARSLAYAGPSTQPLKNVRIAALACWRGKGGLSDKFQNFLRWEGKGEASPLFALSYAKRRWIKELY